MPACTPCVNNVDTKEISFKSFSDRAHAGKSIVIGIESIGNLFVKSVAIERIRSADLVATILIFHQCVEGHHLIWRPNASEQSGSKRAPKQFKSRPELLPK